MDPNIKSDSSAPLVSIIMAAHNAESTIQVSIDSVLAQTYSNWELIIVNDCSTDSTESTIKEYNDNRIVYVKNSTNIGVGKTRKKAINIAKGEWIAILDSDDAWTPNKLEKQISYAQKRNSSFVFCGSAFMDKDGHSIGWQLHVPETVSYKALLKQNLISNSSALIRSELLRESLVDRDDLHEDYAVWLKITQKKIIATGIDEPLLIYRLSSSSKTGNKVKSAKMNWNTYRFVGLNFFMSTYYMIWYTINGCLKYYRLRKATTNNIQKINIQRSYFI